MAESEFKTIETQEELNRIINDRLNRERAKYADYDALKAAKAELDGLKGKDYPGEIERLKGEIAAQKATIDGHAEQLTAAQNEAMRYRVASEAGLPFALAGRLQGEDEAAVRKDAEALKEIMGSGKPTQPLADPESNGKKSPWDDLSRMIGET